MFFIPTHRRFLWMYVISSVYITSFFSILKNDWSWFLFDLVFSQVNPSIATIGVFVVISGCSTIIRCLRDFSVWNVVRNIATKSFLCLRSAIQQQLHVRSVGLHVRNSFCTCETHFSVVHKRFSRVSVLVYMRYMFFSSEFNAVQFDSWLFFFSDVVWIV